MKTNERHSKKKVSKVLVTFAMVVGCGLGLLSMTGCGIPGASAAETDHPMDPAAMQTMETTEPAAQDTPDTVINEAPRTTVYEAPRNTVYEGSKTTINEGSKTTIHESNRTTVNEAPRTNVEVSQEVTVNETPAVEAEDDPEPADCEEEQNEAVCEEDEMTTEEAVSAIIGVWLPETIDTDSNACHFGYLGAGGISSTGSTFGVNTFLVIPNESGSCGGGSEMCTSLDGTMLTCTPVQNSCAAGAPVEEMQIDISQIECDVITINGEQYERYSDDPSVRDYQQ